MASRLFERGIPTFGTHRPALDLGPKDEEKTTPILLLPTNKALPAEIDEITRKITPTIVTGNAANDKVPHEQSFKIEERAKGRGRKVDYFMSDSEIETPVRCRSQIARIDGLEPLYESLQPKSLIKDDAMDFRCVARTTKGPKDEKRKCTNKIARGNIIVARKRLKELEDLTRPGESQKRFGLIISLAELLACKRYHQKDAFSVAQAWDAAITPASERQIVSVSIALDIPTRVTRTTTNRKVCVLGAEITKFGGFDTSRVCIRKFFPFDAKAKYRVNTGDLVRGMIERPLGKRESRVAGLIYIYWFPGNFGHIKIGVTAGTIEKRMRNWQSQCGHDIHLEYPKDEKDFVPIPHVYRVENLIKQQLRHVRRKEIGCRGCGKNHNEWYENALQEAVFAIRKWSTWIREHPYEKHFDGVWRLGKTQKEKIQTLCHPPDPPDVRSRSISTSRWKERNERNSRRLSALPLTHRRTMSAEPPRPNERIAAKERRKSAVGVARPDTKYQWTLNLPGDIKLEGPLRRSSRLAEMEHRRSSATSKASDVGFDIKCKVEPEDSCLRA
ncbi:MAG: hypothetical protein Q9209_000321 [Squamulea sp. 1 TL-2023]